MAGELREDLKLRFKEKMVIVNGEEYVSLDVLHAAILESCYLDSLLGAVATKLKTITVSEDELNNYMLNSFRDMLIERDGDKHIIRMVTE